MKATRVLLMVSALVVILTLGAVAESYPWPQDLGGRTIRIRTRWGSVTPLGLRGEFDFYNPDARMQAHIENVEKMFNVNIEFVEPVTRTPADVAARVLAGEEADYFFSGRKHLPTFVGMGLVEPLGDHLDEEYYSRMPPSFRPTPDAVNLMGETWGFQAKNYTLHPWSVYWNKDMFEREGMPSPYDLYEAGEWTYEAMLELAAGFVRDTTGDGELDQFGIEAGGSFRWYSAVPLNDGQLARIDEHGRWIATLNEPQVVQAIEWYADIHEHSGGSFPNGSAAMRVTWADEGAASHFQNMEEDFGIVPPPKGPAADGYVSHSAGVHLGYISIGTEDPRAVIEVVSALWQLTEPYMSIDLDTWEEELWEQRALLVRDRESLEYWKWMMQNVEGFNFWRIVEELGMLDLVNRVREGSSAAAELSSLNPEFQSWLDDLFDQR